MILFTADLDRTLIYSTRMMRKYPVVGEVLAIEHKGDEVVSLMSRRSMELLHQVNVNHHFVPVTTRSIDQYERIQLFQQSIQPKYAITSNGGTLFVNGTPDAEWGKLIREKIVLTALPNEEMLQAFARIRHGEWVERERCMDGLFYLFYVDEARIPHAELAAFEKELFALGWRMFLQGRKLYVLPTCLNKAAAVAYLQESVDYDVHIAAGDSIMDYDMLIQADIGYSPRHGELFKLQGNDAKITWLNEQGATSAEELISNLLTMNKVELEVSKSGLNV